MLLTIGLSTISAQNEKEVNVPFSWLRKANEAEQKLDSCHALGVVLKDSVNRWKDSTKVSNTKNTKLVKKVEKLTKGRDNWRTVSIVAIIVSTLSIVFK